MALYDVNFGKGIKVGVRAGTPEEALAKAAMKVCKERGYDGWYFGGYTYPESMTVGDFYRLRGGMSFVHSSEALWPSVYHGRKDPVERRISRTKAEEVYRALEIERDYND